VLGLGRVGKEQQDGLLLVNPAQVEQVGVLVEAEGAVGVGRHDVVRVEHDQRVGQEFFDQPAAVLDEEFCIDRDGFHRAQCKRGGTADERR
jgi:hypothetical protein